jgi:hypothetical protein
MSEMVLIGSRAVAFWFPDFKVRDNSDWDIIGTPTDTDVGGRIEWHDPCYLNNSEVWADSPEGLPYDVATPTCLAAIYRSHLHRPEKWDHNITIYHKFLKPAMTFYPKEFLEERKRMTYDEFGNRHPKLKQSNEDFFDDNVEKVYDHDYLHELYAHHDRPLFERLKHEGGESSAWCSKDLWDELGFVDQVRCVAEETYVIATERFLIPDQWKGNYKYAYYRALRKVCTTLTSGWFRDFALDNFPAVWNQFNPERINQVKEKLQ